MFIKQNGKKLIEHVVLSSQKNDIFKFDIELNNYVVQYDIKYFFSSKFFGLIKLAMKKFEKLQMKRVMIVVQSKN